MPEWGPGSDADEAGDGDSGVLSVYWGDVIGVPEPIRKFAIAPVSFILGALFDVFIGGLETVVEAFIDAITSVFEAVASIPESAESLLLDAGGGIGDVILDVLNGMFSTFIEAFSAAGPGAPILAAVVAALVILGAAYAARAIWTSVKLIP